MKFDKFTIKVQEAMMSARSLAQTNDNQQIEPVHILISLIEQQDGITRPLLQKLGVNVNKLLYELNKDLDRLPKVTGSGATDVLLSPNSGKLFDKAWKEAEVLKDQFLSTEHLLLAISKMEATSEYAILKRYGITSDRIMQALTSIRGSQNVTDQDPEGKYRAIEKYSRNL